MTESHDPGATGHSGPAGRAPTADRLESELTARFGPPAAMPAGLAAALAAVAPREAGAVPTTTAAPLDAAPSAAADQPRTSVLARVRGGAVARPRRAMAAAVAMVLLGGWLALRFGPGPAGPADPYATGPFRPVAAVFAARLESGFTPDWVCGDDAEFRAITERLHGQALSMGDPAAEIGGVRMLGVAASHTFSRRTLNVLLRIDGMPAMVVIDRRARVADRPEAIGALADLDGRPLHVHRRRVGELELLELSPFTEPRALPRFGPVVEDRT